IRERLLFLQKNQSEILLIGFDGRIQVCRDLSQFAGFLLELFIQIFAPPNDGSSRLLELRVLLDHRVDGIFIGDLRMVLFDIRDPEGEESSPQIMKSGKEIDRHWLHSVKILEIAILSEL